MDELQKSQPMTTIDARLSLPKKYRPRFYIQSFDEEQEDIEINLKTRDQIWSKMQDPRERFFKIDDQIIAFSSIKKIVSKWGDGKPETNHPPRPREITRSELVLRDGHQVDVETVLNQKEIDEWEGFFKPKELEGGQHVLE